MQDSVTKDYKRLVVNVHYLLYHTVVRWVKAFKVGQQNVTDMPRPGHPAVREEDVQTVNMLVLADHWGREVLYHPPYSPDLRPCDYDLILKIKEPLHATCFRTVYDVPQATDHSLCNVQRLGSANGIQQLPYRWKYVIHNGHSYIEGL